MRLWFNFYILFDFFLKEQNEKLKKISDEEKHKLKLFRQSVRLLLLLFIFVLFLLIYSPKPVHQFKRGMNHKNFNSIKSWLFVQIFWIHFLRYYFLNQVFVTNMLLILSYYFFRSLFKIKLYKTIYWFDFQIEEKINKLMSNDLLPKLSFEPMDKMHRSIV